MVHESEETFHERVHQQCVEWFGADAVESNKYLPEPRRYVDLWVEGPFVTYAVEVENDFDAAIRGVGQAILYSRTAENAIPVVVLPPKHVEYPEVAYLRAYVPIVELDV